MNTQEQIIELAKQAGFDTINDKVYVFAGQHYISVELELYTKLVRNAALEEAAQKCRDATSSIWDYHEDGRKEIGTTVCNNLAADLESLKEPTP